MDPFRCERGPLTLVINIQKVPPLNHSVSKLFYFIFLRIPLEELFSNDAVRKNLIKLSSGSRELKCPGLI